MKLVGNDTESMKINWNARVLEVDEEELEEGEEEEDEDDEEEEDEDDDDEEEEDEVPPFTQPMYVSGRYPPPFIG